MADVAAAREDIQRVVALLVNRMGYESDVFAHLTSALAHLKDKPVRVVETPLAPEPVAEFEAAVDAVEDEPVVVAEPPPAQTRRAYGRRK